MVAQHSLLNQEAWPTPERLYETPALDDGKFIYCERRHMPLVLCYHMPIVRPGLKRSWLQGSFSVLRSLILRSPTLSHGCRSAAPNQIEPRTCNLLPASVFNL